MQMRFDGLLGFPGGWVTQLSHPHPSTRTADGLSWIRPGVSSFQDLAASLEWKRNLEHAAFFSLHGQTLPLLFYFPSFCSCRSVVYSQLFFTWCLDWRWISGFLVLVEPEGLVSVRHQTFVSFYLSQNKMRRKCWRIESWRTSPTERTLWGWDTDGKYSDPSL